MYKSRKRQCSMTCRLSLHNNAVRSNVSVYIARKPFSRQDHMMDTSERNLEDLIEQALLAAGSAQTTKGSAGRFTDQREITQYSYTKYRYRMGRRQGWRLSQKNLSGL